MLATVLALFILAPTPAPKQVHINPRFLTTIRGPNPHQNVNMGDTNVCSNCH